MSNETDAVHSRLVLIDAASELKAKYFYTLDTKDWVGYASVFAPDAEFRTRLGVVTGREAIVSWIAGLGTGTTVHHGHTPSFQIVDAATVRARWAMYDYVEFPDGSGHEGYGYYHDVYQERAGKWEIASTELVRLHLASLPGGGSDGHLRKSRSDHS